MTKTVAVWCFRCGWEGRKYRTEMMLTPRRCPKCRHETVFHKSPEMVKKCRCGRPATMGKQCGFCYAAEVDKFMKESRKSRLTVKGARCVRASMDPTGTTSATRGRASAGGS